MCCKFIIEVMKTMILLLSTMGRKVRWSTVARGTLRHTFHYFVTISAIWIKFTWEVCISTLYLSIIIVLKLEVFVQISGVIFARNSISIISIFFKAYIDIIDITSIFLKAYWNPRCTEAQVHV